MRNQKRSHRHIFYSVRSSHNALWAAMVARVSPSWTKRLAVKAISPGVSLHAMALANVFITDVSSSEFIAYHLVIGYDLWLIIVSLFLQKIGGVYSIGSRDGIFENAYLGGKKCENYKHHSNNAENSQSQSRRCASLNVWSTKMHKMYVCIHRKI